MRLTTLLHPSSYLFLRGERSGLRLAYVDDDTIQIGEGACILLRAMQRGAVSSRRVAEGLVSWFAHLRHADTYRLRCQLVEEVNALMGATC